MGLFSRKQEEAKVVMASDRLIIEQMVDDDAKAAHLVDKLKEGNPLILNFDGLDQMILNKFLAFFAGAAYALDGKTVLINNTTYLFAKKIDFMDGSLQKFIQNLPKSK